MAAKDCSGAPCWKDRSAMAARAAERAVRRYCRADGAQHGVEREVPSVSFAATSTVIRCSK